MRPWVVDSFAQWIKVSCLARFNFWVRIKHLSNQIKFEFFTNPSQCNHHLVLNVQRNLNEGSSTLCIHHLFRLTYFDTIFNVIEVLWRVHQLDVRDAHFQIFNVYISISARFRSSRLSWTQRVSYLLPFHWLECKRIYNFEAINSTKSAFFHVDCLKCDKKFVRVNELVHDNILTELQVVSRVQGEGDEKRSIVAKSFCRSFEEAINQRELILYETTIPVLLCHCQSFIWKIINWQPVFVKNASKDCDYIHCKRLHRVTCKVDSLFVRTLDLDYTSFGKHLRVSCWLVNFPPSLQSNSQKYECLLRIRTVGQESGLAYDFVYFIERPFKNKLSRGSVFFWEFNTSLCGNKWQLIVQRITVLNSDSFTWINNFKWHWQGHPVCGLHIYVVSHDRQF